MGWRGFSAGVGGGNFVALVVSVLWPPRSLLL